MVQQLIFSSHCGEGRNKRTTSVGIEHTTNRNQIKLVLKKHYSSCCRCRCRPGGGGGPVQGPSLFPLPPRASRWTARFRNLRILPTSNLQVGISSANISKIPHPHQRNVTPPQKSHGKIVALNNNAATASSLPASDRSAAPESFIRQIPWTHSIEGCKNSFIGSTWIRADRGFTLRCKLYVCLASFVFQKNLHLFQRIRFTQRNFCCISKANLRWSIEKIRMENQTFPLIYSWSVWKCMFVDWRSDYIIQYMLVGPLGFYGSI